MTNSRTILISLDHLVAEVVAFPFSAECMDHATCLLDPGLKNSTGAMWREAERFFTGRFPHTSIDELISLRNRMWFGGARELTNSDPVPLGAYLQGIAQSYLEVRGPVAVPRLPPALHGRGGIASGEAPDPAARRAWRWLTFAMPADLLLAGLRSGESGPVQVDVVSPSVGAMLQQGYAETHLHFGIAFDYTMGWAAAVNHVGRADGMAWNAFASPGAAHDEGTEVASWLVRGAIVRYLLAAYLKWGHLPGKTTASGKPGSNHRTLVQFLNDDDGLATLLSSPGFSTYDISAVRMALNDLSAGRLNSLQGTSAKPVFVQLQSAYNRLTKVSLQKFPSSIDDVQSLDPLSAFYPAHPHAGPSVQLQFLWNGLEHLETHPEDIAFARLFWQVERVRCQVYRHCIQRPLTPGLTNFVRFYERKGAFCSPIDNVVLESAGVLGGVGRGLHSLEVRTSPRKDRDSQLKEIVRLRKAAQGFRSPANRRDWSKTECGLVLHFLKFRGKSADNGLPTAGDTGNFADPGSNQNTKGYRWQRYFLDRWREARAIADAIDKAVKWKPASKADVLDFLCGIDVCRDEPGVPTWVVAPLFHEVRNSINKTRAEYRIAHQIELPALRTTAHVGEDFVHLASGVRFMDEAQKFLPLEAGDRVGHGLALGVDADEWARRSSRLTMPREDRWFDLVWERCWHADPKANFGAARKAFIEDEIIRLANLIFDDGSYNWTVQRAIEFCCQLHDFKKLQSLGFPDHGFQHADRPSGLDGQLELYLTSSKVYRNCRAVDWVESGSDGEAVAELQRLVRRRFADVGITIEVNPISNLLVGDLSDIESHPLWRLAPGLGKDFGATLRMCVGSDDPFPFATNLPEEYQFLFDSLVLAGRSQADARQWLDTIRQLGWESRFTRPVPN